MSTTYPAGFALAADDPDAEAQHPLATEEWLASLVLQHINDVRAVCRLALVNKNFHTASRSDVVWQKRLPPKPVLDAVGAPALGKRDLYFHLCKSVSYENGLKKLWLDPASGGECYMISARGLTITWGDTPQYWKWKRCAGSMFRKVAYLHTVCWFEIVGVFEQRLRPGKYMLSFRMQMNSPAAWGDSPVKLRIENTKYAHEPNLSQVLFDNAASFKRRHCPSPDDDDRSSHAEDVSVSFSQAAEEQLNEDRGFEDDDNPLSSAESIHSWNEDRGFEDDDNPSSPPESIHSWNKDRGFEDGDNPLSSPVSIHSSGFESMLHDYGESLSPEEVWIECDAGEFLVEDENDDQPIKLHFSMRETEVLYWKGGFVLDGVIVRPYDVAMSRLIE